MGVEFYLLNENPHKIMSKIIVQLIGIIYKNAYLPSLLLSPILLSSLYLCLTCWSEGGHGNKDEDKDKEEKE